MRRTVTVYAAGLGLLAIAALLSVGLGAVSIPPHIIARILAKQVPGLTIPATWPTAYADILLQVRLPHTILIILTGAALAGSGAAYQGLFRNPLADPYLIGVASGAGLGAVIVLSLGPAIGVTSMLAVPAAAFAGALSTILLVYSLARLDGYVPLTTLILAGVAVGTLASGITSILMLRSDEMVTRALSFLLGGSPTTGWQPVVAAFPYFILGLSGLSFSGHPLNVLQFGEEQARQMGLNVDRAKVVIIALASLNAAAAVSFSGVIGFVGLIVPHLIRILWGPDYRGLIPLSMIGGAAALLLADVGARILLAPQSLPVGIVTSLAGAPFFLWILRRAKREVFW